ncbi:helix-turn-helix domain-containing protein [Marinomonas atlantica]|uniref:helix-turn-helix domain-containing protein n=1 Tax=Marinomonas atlantica TaxID=1806668 RepID=UPI00082D59BC|nr:AraC family transcriptional regulator [Marinomonas atlantica]MCO4785038.1 AraC family transcriptional regulator [Marinomonas atlantica]
MKTWRLPPLSEAVAQYVECYWFLEKEPHDLSNRYPKLNPDPCAHLIIATPHNVFDYAHKEERQSLCGSHWIFPHRQTFTMDHSSPFSILGVKFRVGALYSLFDKDPCTLIEQVHSVDVSQLWGSTSCSPESLLVNAAERSQQLSHRLDTYLATWIANSHEDRHSQLVRHILQQLDKGQTITEIGLSLHRSQRTIERSFIKVTGLTMKQVHSMNRLENLLNYLYQLGEAEINWSDVANKYDFSDQPHLIRYLKNTIGQTPSDYAQNRDLTIDVYGDFEYL